MAPKFLMWPFIILIGNLTIHSEDTLYMYKSHLLCIIKTFDGRQIIIHLSIYQRYSIGGTRILTACGKLKRDFEEKNYIYY